MNADTDRTLDLAGEYEERQEILKELSENPKQLTLINVPRARYSRGFQQLRSLRIRLSVEIQLTK